MMELRVESQETDGALFEGYDSLCVPVTEILHIVCRTQIFSLVELIAKAKASPLGLPGAHGDAPKTFGGR